MSSIYVKNICAQLAQNTLVGIYSTFDLSHIFDGMVAKLPPVVLLLEVVKLQKQNNKYILHVR